MLEMTVGREQLESSRQHKGEHMGNGERWSMKRSN